MIKGCCVSSKFRGFRGVLRVFKESLKCASRVFQRSSKEFHGNIKGVSRKFKWSFMEISRVFQENFMVFEVVYVLFLRVCLKGYKEL